MKVESLRVCVGGLFPGVAQAALDALDCQIAVLAASGQVVVANQAWTRLAESNLPCATHVPAGRNYLQVFEHGISGDALHAAAGVHAVLSRQTNKISVEYPCNACGKQIWFKMDATACEISGSPHTVVVHRSIAQTSPPDAKPPQDTQQQVDASQGKGTPVEEELRAQLARKDQFLAILLHELRNPLAPIANAVELLGRHPDDPRVVTEARNIMQRQLRQMTRIMDNMFDVSHRKSDDVVPGPLRVDISEPLATAVESAQPLIDLREHSLRVAVTPGRYFVHADGTRLAQVFTNLLINAAKYTKPGGYISLMVESEGDNVIVRVRDSGIGIAPVHQGSVFELFKRAAPGSAAGMGVGLAVARELVEEQGGAITVHSEGVGMGSEFIVSLPEAR